MRKPIWMIALVLTIAMLGACGGDGGDGGEDAAGSEVEADEDAGDEDATSEENEGDPGGGTLTVTARDFSFDPNLVEVEAGGEVTLTFANDGEVPHTFTSDALGVDERAAPGETVEVTFTAPDGEVEFHCSIHPGMIGNVTTG